MLSLLDLPIPPYMQGRAFLGREAAAPREYIFGARDRVDEAEELTRSVSDQRYLYLRNFMPDLSWNQPETYSDQLELRREITHLAAGGKLNAAQLTYAGPVKPSEALYDTQKDPWQLKNLADDPACRPVVERLRRTLRAWQAEMRDVGMIHEGQAAQLCMETGRSLFELAREPNRIALDRVLDTAWRVGWPEQVAAFTERLADADPTVRYWAAIGLRVAGHAAVAAKDALQKALADESLSVRIEAAGILVRQGSDRAALEQLMTPLVGDDENAQMHAARTLQLLGEQARPALPALQTALPQIKNMYARWSIQGVIALLTGTEASIFKPRTKAAPKQKRPATPS